MSEVVIAVGNVGAIAATRPLEILADALGWMEMFLVFGATTPVLAVICAMVIYNHPFEKGISSMESVEDI